MKLELNHNVEHILILGAGSSVDYGLPIWRELCQLIKDKITSDKNNLYKYHKEILEWVDKVGEKREYTTIDECIAKESVKHHSGGDKIEDQIFLIMKDVFNEKYKNNNDGWIKLLNEKILSTRNLEYQFAFINYNYDNVLSRNFLKFRHLSDKERNLTHKLRLANLSTARSNALHPHGYISHDEETEDENQLYIQTDTIKSNNDEYIDMISCHDSKNHSIHKPNLVSSVKLYFLGLGGGLRVNLSKINFENPVSEIHITIKNASKNEEEEVIDFLSKKFKKTREEIKIYSDCIELIEKCF